MIDSNEKEIKKMICDDIDDLIKGCPHSSELMIFINEWKNDPCYDLMEIAELDHHYGKLIIGSLNGGSIALCLKRIENLYKLMWSMDLVFEDARNWRAGERTLSAIIKIFR